MHTRHLAPRPDARPLLLARRRQPAPERFSVILVAALVVAIAAGTVVAYAL